MAPSPEALALFAEHYNQVFGEQLTTEEVERKARMLLNLYIAVYRTPLEEARVQELYESS